MAIPPERIPESMRILSPSGSLGTLYCNTTLDYIWLINTVSIFHHVFMSFRLNIYIYIYISIVVIILAFGGPYRFPSILCHYRFWRGPYLLTVFRSHLTKVFLQYSAILYGVTVVFNHFGPELIYIWLVYVYTYIYHIYIYICIYINIYIY